MNNIKLERKSLVMALTVTVALGKSFRSHISSGRLGLMFSLESSAGAIFWQAD